MRRMSPEWQTHIEPTQFHETVEAHLRKFTDIQCHPERLEQPLHWRKPRKVFVNSMSDLFHDAVDRDFILQVFRTMELCPQHTFQILTKRPERMQRLVTEWLPPVMRIAYLNESHPWPLPNVWLGVSVENQATADERIPLLLQTPAAVKFVSYEPALGPVEFRKIAVEKGTEHNALTGEGYADDFLIAQTKMKLDWVICGGESGPHARPMHPDWVRSARDQCVAAGVPFFFKQWGEWGPGRDHPRRITRGNRTRIVSPVDGQDKPLHKNTAVMVRVGKKLAGRMLDGREWNEFPNV